MFNIILDNLPAEYNGRLVLTDFKQVLKYYRLIIEDKFDDQDKMEMIIAAFFGENVYFTESEIPGIWPFIQSYISGGEEIEEEADEKEPVFDFNVDNSRLYAAFYQVYGIDLRKEEMHWFKFLSLFQSISEGTALNKVIDIRTKEIPADADAKYKRKLKAAKKAFQINRGSKEEQQKKEEQRVVNFFKGWN